MARIKKRYFILGTLFVLIFTALFFLSDNFFCCVKSFTFAASSLLSGAIPFH